MLRSNVHFSLMLFFWLKEIKIESYNWDNGHEIDCLNGSFSIKNTLSMTITSSGELIQFTRKNRLGIFNAEFSEDKFKISKKGIGGTITDYSNNLNDEEFYRPFSKAKFWDKTFAVKMIDQQPYFVFGHLLNSFNDPDYYFIFGAKKDAPNEFIELFNFKNTDLFNQNKQSFKRILRIILVGSDGIEQDPSIFVQPEGNFWYFGVEKHNSQQDFIYSNYTLCNDQEIRLIYATDQCDFNSRFRLLDAVNSAFIFKNTLYMLSFDFGRVYSVDVNLFLADKTYLLSAHKLTDLFECSDKITIPNNNPKPTISSTEKLFTTEEVQESSSSEEITSVFIKQSIISIISNESNNFNIWFLMLILLFVLLIIVSVYCGAMFLVRARKRNRKANIETTSKSMTDSSKKFPKTIAHKKKVFLKSKIRY